MVIVYSNICVYFCEGDYKNEEAISSLASLMTEKFL